MAQPRIVLAAVRIELCGTLLKRRQGQEHRLEGQRGVLENVAAEGGAKLRCISSTPNLLDHRVSVRIRELERREKRQPRLIVHRLRSPVPGPASRRALIDAVISLI